MNDQTKINFTDLSIKEVEVMLTGMAQLPYIQVAELIGKLQGQVQMSIAAANMVNNPEGAIRG